ncbi:MULTISPECIES: flagellar motor switch protein FliN [unclassified Thioalkalivibrio]|uniref:flagellar motor switch protein FliN n=1 Tax=unclassified Thioalkalivibrio TaxID=2621013 RepID=UPI0003771230|nr:MULTISPECIES: flagellar motor switch protein FliN [unclassified Thioalkalivibrio]PYG04075.1 flagellar motor switch protein FliN/FliY [Thioalkalivibrio sp. ALE21]
MADDDKRPDQETEQGDGEESVDQDALADEWAAALAEQDDSSGGEAEDPDALLAQAQSNSHESDAANAASTGTGGRSKAAAGGEKERKHKPDPNAQPLEPDELTDSGGGEEEDVNLDMVLDVPVTISMEIGRTRIPIRNLLQLNQGSVVELERLAGEPLDVLVNGTLIAHGEVVVVNEKFGIRLTDVISPSERIRKLK